MQKKFILPYAVLIFAFGVQNSQSIKLLQSPEPASGWRLYSASLPNRLTWINSFIEDCKAFALQNTAIPVHDRQSIVRFATYNVHFWCDLYVAPFDYNQRRNRHTLSDIENNFSYIIQTIKTINADVLCLQEFLLFDEQRIEQTLKDMGYIHLAFFQEAQWEQRFGVLIASRYPFANAFYGKTFKADKTLNAHPLEKHCFVNAQILLANNKIVNVYTSHFDCFDNTEQIRHDEIDELIKLTQSFSNQENHLICGDFNAVRFKDLQYFIGSTLAWDLLNRDNLERTHFPTPTKALSLLENYGFQDCFTKGDITMPKFSVWNGTVVDFIFLSKSWNLPICGCYFYYTSASDHLPVIMDCQIS